MSRRFELLLVMLFLGLFSTAVRGVEYGIAADYPGDVGIENDAAVVFVEFFEQAYSGTDKFWPDPGGSPFLGFQWCTVNEFLIKYIWIYNYLDTDPGCQAWFDRVVAATQYIGPMVDSAPYTTPPQAPTNLLVQSP